MNAVTDNSKERIGRFYGVAGDGVVPEALL